MPGFAPIPDDILRSLSTVTGDDSLLPVRKIEIEQHGGKITKTTGTYYMEESELPIELQGLLHGRAYIIDRQIVPNNSQSNPITFYIAANKTKGLIIPGRSLFIESIGTVSHYRWTDDGEKWTEWNTLDNGDWNAFTSDENCRFAEIQVYVDTINEKISIKVTR